MGKKYTYEDVFRLLNWKKNEVALNVGGYKFDAETMTYPVFVNYDKSQEINDTIRYEDRFWILLLLWRFPRARKFEVS